MSKNERRKLEHVAYNAIIDLRKERLAREAATVKLATVQAENRRLRRMVKNNESGQILSRAATDAKQLCAWRWAVFSVSRSAALSYGMSRRRWMWAVALLERARVVDDGRYLDDAFILDDLNEAVAALDTTVKVVEQRGLELLAMRLPKNGRAGRKRS